MRASGCAPIRVITELMDVHAPLGIGIMAGDVPRDRCWRGLGRLLESYCASDLGVSTKLSNYSKEGSQHH